MICHKVRTGRGTTVICFSLGENVYMSVGVIFLGAS